MSEVIDLTIGLIFSVEIFNFAKSILVVDGIFRLVTVVR